MATLTAVKNIAEAIDTVLGTELIKFSNLTYSKITYVGGAGSSYSSI
jgi:hypothetical protein